MKYDDDKNGELDFHETKNYVKDVIGFIPDDVFKSIFREFDKDGSGAIGKDEMGDFIKMFNKDRGESSKNIDEDIMELEQDDINQ